MFKPVFLRAAYNYDVDAVSHESGISFDPDDSVVQQQFAEECDINTIVRRFGLTGELPSNLRMPISGDFVGVPDYHTAMNMVRRADEEFMRVPAEVRARFNNDPGALIAFLEDKGNHAEAVRLGLVAKPVEVDRVGGAVPAPVEVAK